MLNMFYNESEHMKEVRKKYLEKVSNEPHNNFEQIDDSLDRLNYSIEEQKDSEKSYFNGYINGQMDAMVLTGVGFAVGFLAKIFIKSLKKIKD